MIMKLPEDAAATTDSLSSIDQPDEDLRFPNVKKQKETILSDSQIQSMYDTDDKVLLVNILIGLTESNVKMEAMEKQLEAVSRKQSALERILKNWTPNSGFCDDMDAVEKLIGAYPVKEMKSLKLLQRNLKESKPAKEFFVSNCFYFLFFAVF